MLAYPLVRVVWYVSVPVCFLVLQCHSVVFIFKLFFVPLISVGFQKAIVFILVNVITYFSKESVFFFISPHTRCSLCSAACLNFPSYWLIGTVFWWGIWVIYRKHAFFTVHLLLMKMLILGFRCCFLSISCGHVKLVGFCEASFFSVSSLNVET